MKLITRATSAMTAMAAAWKGFNPAANPLPGERGDRLASDIAMERLYRQMWIDTTRRAMIQQVRTMDTQDGRVKQIHSRVARDCIRGGLVL